MDPLLSALIVLIGFVASVSGGFWGLGGGWLILPCLFLINIDVKVAIGACLLQMIPTTFPTVMRQLPEIGWKKGGWGLVVAMPLCIACMCGGVLGDPLGTLLESLFESRKIHQSMYLLLLFWVLYDLYRQNGKHSCMEGKIDRPAGKMTQTLIGGFVTGLVSGFLGIGGGTMTRPLMTSVLKVPEKQIGQIARLAILVTAVAGSIPYLITSTGETRNKMLIIGALLTAGGIIGFSIGAKMHSVVLKAGKDQTARKSFGLIVIMVMGGLICKLTDFIHVGQVIMGISGAFILIYLGFLTFKCSKMETSS
ncbi:MAG: sulfite exporter TauE/SafE family protein [Victivallales bacterium]